MAKATYTCKEVYKTYAAKLIEDNPKYWGEFKYRISNGVVYKRIKNTVIEVMSYPRFKEIIDKYFERARFYIIEGYELNLGNDLGKIAARRVERNFKNKQINYHETAKQPKKEDGKPVQIIYHNEPDWCRIGWKKTSKIRNIRDYAFAPTPHDGKGKGFKYEFNQALKNNSLLRYRYEYFPYIMDQEDDI